MNCLYNLDNVYAFNGNTTAFIEMEDGINYVKKRFYIKVRQFSLFAIKTTKAK